MPLDLSLRQMLPDTFVVEVEIIFDAELTLVLEILPLDILIGISNRMHPYFLVVLETRREVLIHPPTSLDIAHASMLLSAEYIHIFR